MDEALLVRLVLKLHEVQELPGGLCPHVYGEHALVGGWDPAKAVPLEREGSTVWSLGIVLPSAHEPLAFRFILRPRAAQHPCVVEAGAVRYFVGEDSDRNRDHNHNRDIATFPLATHLHFPVSLHSTPVSPFALAHSWEVHEEAIKGANSQGRGTKDVEIGRPDAPKLSRTVDPVADLEKFSVPLPDRALRYLADSAEAPRSNRSKSDPVLPHPAPPAMHSVVSITDLVLLGEAAAGQPRTVGRLPPLGDAESVLLTSPADTSEGRTGGRAGSASSASDDAGEDGEGLLEASGAGAAAAAAERMLGPKERRRLALVLVGLPARGKTFTAAKLTRYLRWLGHDTKHFNVGKQSADFFRADNLEGIESRNEVAQDAFLDMMNWMEEGGQVGIFDATNSTNERRAMLRQLAGDKCKMIFLESICTDPAVVEQNVLEKVKKSPDYADEPDVNVALADFKARLANYEKVYESVSEGSYIKMIDTASKDSSRMHINDISGYLPGRIVFFLVNTHLAPRPILLTRHGESEYNVRGRIGGDPGLSPTGECYAEKLAEFVGKRLGAENTASIWTSTLQRTVLSARHIHGYPKVQWRALDEINAGVCDGMTYAEIKESMPEEYRARKQDKLRYRYPRGESYLDVIQRLEPVIIELERQRAPVVVVAHQAILRALYAYFMDKPLNEISHIEVPLHTIIELSTGVSEVMEKRFQLMDPIPH